MTLSKREKDALRYLQAQGSIWTLAATRTMFLTLVSLREKGLVRFVLRPPCNGEDVYLAAPVPK